MDYWWKYVDCQKILKREPSYNALQHKSVINKEWTVWISVDGFPTKHRLEGASRQLQEFQSHPKVLPWWHYAYCDLYFPFSTWGSQKLHWDFISENVQEDWWGGVKPDTSCVQNALSRILKYFLRGVSATVGSLINRTMCAPALL